MCFLILPFSLRYIFGTKIELNFCLLRFCSLFTFLFLVVYRHTLEGRGRGGDEAPLVLVGLFLTSLLSFPLDRFPRCLLDFETSFSDLLGTSAFMKFSQTRLVSYLISLPEGLHTLNFLVKILVSKTPSLIRFPSLFTGNLLSRY